MPLYEFECINCGRREEIRLHHSEKHNVRCNECLSMMVEIPSAAEFVIKGCRSHKGVGRKNYE